MTNIGGIQLGSLQLGNPASAGSTSGGPIVHEKNASNTITFSQTATKLAVFDRKVKDKFRLRQNPGRLNKIASGLLYATDFSDTTGWIINSGWSFDFEPNYVGYTSQIEVFNKRAVGELDGGGVREPHLIIDETGKWHLFYDAGTGQSGVSGYWHILRASSTDKGLTWTRHGRITMVHTGSAYASWKMHCMAGWITKHNDGYYYLQVLNSNNTIGSLSNVPGPNYANSVYRSSTLDGTWTWVRDSPALGGSGEFDQTTNTISMIFDDGEKWVGYYSARSNSAVYNIGRVTSTYSDGPDGPYTRDPGIAILPSDVNGSNNNIGACENPKVWYSTALERWIIFANSLGSSAYLQLWIAPSEGDFRTSLVKSTRVCRPGDNGWDGRVQLSPCVSLCDNDGNVIQDEDGNVGFFYGGDLSASNPDTFSFHNIRVGQLEKSRKVAKYTSATPGYLTRTSPADDFIAEFVVEATGLVGHNANFVYRLTQSGGVLDAHSTGYVVDFNFNVGTVGLYKIVSGTFTALDSGSTAESFATYSGRTSHQYRIKVVVSGNNHKVYCNGKLHVNYTDGSPLSIGPLVGFRGDSSASTHIIIRRFNMRTSDDVVVDNCPPSATVTLRGAGGVPFATGTANGSGLITLNNYHYPLTSIDVDGDNYLVNDYIYGGDSYRLVRSGKNLADNNIINREVNQTITFAHTINPDFVFNRAISHTVSFAQSAGRVFEVDADNTITFAHNNLVRKEIPVTVPQTVTFSQSVAKNVVYSRLVVQGLFLSHSHAKNYVLNFQPTHVLPLTHSNIHHYIKPVFQNILFEQEVSVVKAKHVHHYIEYSQSTNLDLLIDRPMNNAFNVFQLVSVEKKYNRTVVSNLNLTQSVGLTRTKAAVQNLNFTHSVVVHATKSAKNTLTLTQSVSVQHIANPVVKNNLLLANDATVNKVVSRSAANAFGINQSVKKTKVITRTVSQTLSLSSVANKGPAKQNVSQNITFAQSTARTRVHIRSVSQTLNLTQIVSRNIVINRSVQHTLIFLQNHKIPFGLGGIPTLTLPNVSVIQLPSTETTLVAGKLKQKPRLFVLSVPEQTVVLPAPEWDDSDGNEGELSVRRAMNSELYTYIKSTHRQNLKYRFFLTQTKSEELQEFIWNYNDSIMNILNHKDEIWKAQLKINPVDFVSENKWSCTEKISVTLEFEGVKVN